MRILIANDDGIFSEGIYELAKSLIKVGEVIVIAPDSERSASGHAITMHQPLRVTKSKFFDLDIEAYAVNGTPADCVKLGIEAILKDRLPDVVVSGINNGPNLGTDVIYSGTVSAAVEAAIFEIPSIAISMATSKFDTFEYAAEFTENLIKDLFNKGIHKNQEISETIININYPSIPQENIKGVKITTLGVRKYENAFVERKDPRGNSYYWMSGKVKELEQNETSDIVALENNYISVTPIHFDLTNFKTYEYLKKLDLEKS